MNSSLRNDEQHAVQCHQRWMKLRNRKQEAPNYQIEWADQQCGMCQYWIPLTGALGTDYGACSNSASPFDASVRFEHDGCDEFVDAGEWVTP